SQGRRPGTGQCLDRVDAAVDQQFGAGDIAAMAGGQKQHRGQRVHGELFAEVRPAVTMVVVAGLLDRLWKVEIDAEAEMPP
ncbi:MAG TPA: hypothetical protein VE197_08700, partial [Mycobacterium sp.]|nr:hypothetical protein [Mycobacterium sp.]